ncbi:condensation domain-containing protein [Streptomyces melanogenes]|uniref:condensation domain-containing protein n=1 Tax=Streptomyces melanogenes TaxID=67326 RepID=UPI00378D6FE0
MTPQEQILCGVLADLFARPGIGPEDSFVRLGGDSIIAVQVVGAVRRAGWAVTVRDVLAQPDVAHLAATARPVTRPARPRQEDGVGAVVPTPIMHWLRERGGPADSYHQFMVVRTPAALTLDGAHAVLQALLDRHDMLRLRLTDDGPHTLPVGTVRAEECLTRAVADTAEDIEREVHAARDRLRLADADVVRAVWFDAGPTAPGRLALVVNHMVVDGISWRIITDDLARAWQAVADGRTPNLDPVPTSFRRWSRLLAAEADRRLGELPYWTEVVRPGAATIGRRELDPARDHEDRAAHLTLALPAATTGPLLTRTAERLGADANEILLTGLALALAHWLEQPGDILVNLEGHGREEIAEEADLSRTVGWFTTLFPTRFALADLAAPDAEADGPVAALALRRVKEQLRRIPGKGLGHGLLRHLHPAGGPLAAADRPPLGFNYLGRFPGTSHADWQMLPEYGARLDAPGPGMPMAHPVEVNAIVLETADGPVLHADWAWAPGVLEEPEVRALAETWFRRLAALVAHAERPDAGGTVAADLTLAAIDQDELDDLAASLEAL